ncbi:MAG: SDR family oxidoreductase [Bacteroidota bacterium]
MKKVIVFGSSRGTGKLVVEQALQLGYMVTTVVRNPETYTLTHKNLKVIKGDVLQLNSFINELNGQDAVISCLGIPKIQETTLYSEGMKNIVAAMKETPVNRIICISSGAITTPPGSSFIMSFLLKNVLQRLYKPIYSDMLLMEKTLSDSNLNWTVVGAPKLTDGKQTGNYRIVTNQPLRSIPKISRADLADFMITRLDDENMYKSRVEIAY